MNDGGGLGRLRILVVEDAPADAEIELDELKRAGLEFEARVVETRSDYLDALETFRPDLVLSDYSLPAFDGMAAVTLAAERAPGTPVVIVTGSINEETAVACMRSGAADYMLKDRLGRLGSAVRLALDHAQELRAKRAAEAALLEAELRARHRSAELEALLDAIPIPVWIAHDAEASRISGNPAANRLLRLASGDCSSLADPAAARAADYQVLHAGEPTRLEDLPIQRAARGEDVRGEEEEIAFRDGSRVRILVNATTLRDESGAPRGAISTAADITELVRSEAQLRQLFQAVEQSPVAVVITDETGRMEYVNPRFTQTTGYGFEEAVGQHTRMLKSGETDAEQYRTMWDTISNGGTWRGEFHNRRKDGSLFWEEASISPIHDANGRITHYLAVKEDVTERKRSQRALEETRQQLVQAQKMEAIGRLAGGVAHDFNNLLGVIRGHSELLARQLAPGASQQRDRTEQILKATDRAAGLAAQLLAFGRKQTLKVAIVQLDAVVLEAERMLRRVLGEDVELKVEIEPRLPAVLADPLQLEQVLLNLAVNARDAMPGGGIMSFLVTSPASTDGSVRKVTLSVSDTGCGMDAETLSHIFEPFFTTKAVGKGTGLGLATVYGIVSQLGGEIQVSSTPGLGTTFRVSLPAVAGAPGVAPAPSSVATAGGGETVLVVEDELGLRTLMVELLDSLGYRVLEAGRGSEALELARRHEGRIDLLLTDVVMPGQNGLELAEELRKLRPGIKIVMMSGYATDALHAEKGVDPATRLLSKPFSLEALATTLREALSAAG